MDEDVTILLISLTFLGGGLFSFGYAILLRIFGYSTTARVVSIVEVESSENTSYKPVFELLGNENTDKAKRLAGTKLLSDIGSNLHAHSVGDIVEVFYDIRTSRIVSIKQLYWCLAAGIFFIVAGLIGLGVRFGHITNEPFF